MVYSWVNRTVLASALLALAVSVPTAMAADKDAKYSVRGVGGQKCERFLLYLGSSDPAVKRETALIFDSWLAGYASHVNRVAEDTYDISPVLNKVDLLNLLARQCAKSPGALVETIAAGILSGLSAAKVTGESEVVTVGDGVNSREYYRSTIMSVQSKLAEMKLLKSKPDGRFGPMTSTALSRFQKKEKLPETGFLDAQTLLKLMLK